MKIVENLAHWLTVFQEGWLANLKETGQVDWNLYEYPRNSAALGGPGVNLAESRLMLVSTAGAYLKDGQEPFDCDSLFGDYSIRTFPFSTPWDELTLSHTHYDHSAVNADHQTLLPFEHLADMVEEGLIGELAPSVVSFSGYHPNVWKVVKELTPAVLEVAKDEAVDAVLLVPA